MIEKIEIYIRNEEVVTGQTTIGRPIGEHWCTAKETFKTEKVIPEADRLALEVVNEVAKERGLHVEIHDIASFKGKLRGKWKGVTKTPTIVIGDMKIEGVPDKEQILNLLQQ